MDTQELARLGNLASVGKYRTPLCSHLIGLYCEANFHGNFTEIFTDVGVTWVAKMQYTVSP